MSDAPSPLGAVADVVTAERGLHPYPTEGHRPADWVKVGQWTLVSRGTGFARVAVIGATLGPTFFANIFQATNLLPNMFFVVVGALLTTLLVPTLVEALEHHDVRRAREIARGFLGVLLVALSLLSLVVVAAGPLLARALTLGIEDPSAAATARRQAWLLLVLVVPQVVLYAVVAVGVAAQNARQRFSLAAAAPAVENVGLIATLLVCAYLFGTGRDGAGVSSAHLCVLGVGATMAVAAHAGLQLLGAARAGLGLWPRWGWRDADVRLTLRRTAPSLSSGLLDAMVYLGVIVAAGVVPGGVVALQIAFNFYNLPIAMGARSIGTALLPRLARSSARRDLRSFREAYDGGVGLTWFVAVPAGLAMTCLAGPLAAGLAFGELATAGGVDLLSVSIASLGLAVIGGSTFEVARQAAYARFNTSAPVRAGLVRAGVATVGAVMAVAVADGPAVLFLLGATVTLGDCASACFLHRAVCRGLPARARGVTGTSITLVASVVMLVPAALAARLVPETVHGRLSRVAGIVAASVVGLVLYVVVQYALRSPALASFGGSLRRRASTAEQTGATT